MALADNTVTRWPNGVSSNAENALFASLKAPDLSGYHWYFEDFDQFTLAQWTTGGVGTPVAPALSAGDGGLVTLVNSAADNDNNWLQQLVPAWTFAAGKRLFFKARVSVNSVSIGEVVAGLQVAVAANNFLTPADGVFIRRNNGSSDVFLVSRVGGVETVSTALGQTPSGLMGVGFAYDGAGTLYAAFSSDVDTPLQVVAAITPASITAVALGIVVGVQNGTAAARTMNVDQIFCAKDH